MIPDPDRYYSVNEIAKYLSLHTKTVSRALRMGRMEGRRVGRTWRVKKDWADGFLRKQAA